jgi:hypothetical protein
VYESPGHVGVLQPQPNRNIAHVLWLLGIDVRPCPGIIPKSYTLRYRDIYRRRLSDELLCQQMKAVVSDFIDNIQERMSIAMLTSANAKRTGLFVYVHLFLSPPANLQNNHSHLICFA